MKALSTSSTASTESSSKKRLQQLVEQCLADARRKTKHRSTSTHQKGSK